MVHIAFLSVRRGYTNHSVYWFSGTKSVLFVFIGFCTDYTAVAHIFELDRSEISVAWPKFAEWLDRTLGCADDLEGILFLVGIQESDQEFAPDLDKASKQRLVHEGTYCVLERLGCFERVGREVDGFWIWEPHEDLPEDMNASEQDLLLRAGILKYFDHYLSP